MPAYVATRIRRVIMHVARARVYRTISGMSLPLREVAHLSFPVLLSCECG